MVFDAGAPLIFESGSNPERGVKFTDRYLGRWSLYWPIFFQVNRPSSLLNPLSPKAARKRTQLC